VGMIEKYNRTIKTKIRIYIKLNKTKTWYKVLPDLLNNNSIHSSINKAPNDVTNKDVNKIRVITINKGKPAIKETKSFKLGDQVRILKKKGVFVKDLISLVSKFIQLMKSINYYSN
jgi:hypothetical protein